MFKLKTLTAAIAATVIMVGSANAALFTANGSLTEANNARAAWEAAVGGVFDVDNLDGIAGSGSVTSTIGNTFTATQGTLSAETSTVGVLDGATLITSTSGGRATFTWDLVSPVSALGFNAFDADTGEVSVTFLDGSNTSFSLATAEGTRTNLFFGITAISPLISAVSISTTDTGGITNWDNFVYSNNVGAIPLPAPILLLLSGLGLMGFIGRRRKTAAA